MEICKYVRAPVTPPPQNTRMEKQLAQNWPKSPVAKSYVYDKKLVSGVKEKVCKTFMRRFDSDPRLQFSQLVPSILVSCPFPANSF